jgi:ArsR family transcriptional regulator, arsenate/arsenite/antimonite-responsive transcriptional repressor
MNLIKVIKALADENRLRILNLINHRELCVCEIESVLGMTQSNVSRHLVKLRDAEIICYEKDGQFVFYTINQQMENEFPCLKDLLNKELIKLKKLQDDLKKLNELSESGLMCIRESCNK